MVTACLVVFLFIFAIWVAPSFRTRNRHRGSDALRRRGPRSLGHGASWVRVPSRTPVSCRSASWISPPLRVLPGLAHALRSMLLHLCVWITTMWDLGWAKCVVKGVGMRYEGQECGGEGRWRFRMSVLTLFVNVNYAISGRRPSVLCVWIDVAVSYVFFFSLVLK